MRRAVIGIGSNSTRLLVADVDDKGNLTNEKRMREGTRLFAGLENGVLSTESMVRTADAVARFAVAARDDGAQTLHVLATSAARDAENSAEFADTVQTLSGVPMEIISGGEEARLSFLGGAGQGYSGLVDIGGGSTEIGIGGGFRPFSAGSIQLGAVRLFGEVPVLLGDGLARAYEIAKERVAAGWADIVGQKHPPAAWYGVGGTMTCLASIDMQLAAFDRDEVDGHALTRGAVENWARRLAKMSMEERAALPGMLAQRADIIAHGAIVLWAVMDALALESILVSNRSNLDGYLRSRPEKAQSSDPVEVVQSYYDTTVESEWERLERNWYEYEINKHYIDRYVKPGDCVLDVGGGPGRYSLYLAGCGAEMTLRDLSPGNVAFAAQKAREQGHSVRTVCGDARKADELVDGQYDVVLLMGPLYHLTTEADRICAVNACLKRLRPGGVLCVAFISTIAGMIYAARELPESIMAEGEDTFYEKIKNREDFAGQAFTQAFFIEPSHVLPFMEQFPLETLHLVNSESIIAPFHNQIMASDVDVRQKWLDLAIALAEREDLRCYTEHFLYIGRKREES